VKSLKNKLFLLAGVAAILGIALIGYSSHQIDVSQQKEQADTSDANEQSNQAANNQAQAEKYGDEAEDHLKALMEEYAPTPGDSSVLDSIPTANAIEDLAVERAKAQAKVDALEKQQQFLESFAKSPDKEYVRLGNLADVKFETATNEFQLADLEQLQCSQIEHKRLSLYQPVHTTGIVFSILCPIFLIAAWLVPNQD
jgi:hypothetical protein